MMIVHITSKTAWQAAQEVGEYRAASLETEGFIHCSTPEQILAVANAFYQNTPELVLLWIDPAKTLAEVRWEDPAHPEITPRAGTHALTGAGGLPQEELSVGGQEKEVFPHLYGSLNLDAVVSAVDFIPDAGGFFQKVPLSVDCK